ncbi:MAG: hypothetical protein AAB289_06085 [Chloroflexota bacterium]
MPFDQNTYPCEPQVKSQIESQLLSRIRSSTASGGTALYDAVAQAYGILENKRRLLGDSFRFGIVILSDGEDNDSKSYTLAKLKRYCAHRSTTRPVSRSMPLDWVSTKRPRRSSPASPSRPMADIGKQSSPRRFWSCTGR